jgi:hypothetical protein
MLRRRRRHAVVEPAPPEPELTEEELRQRSGLASPEDYLAELTSLHQVVMLGDRRGVSQHVELVASMVGPLWRHGVRNLAWEYTHTRRQADLDALLTAADWDHAAAADLFVDLLGIGFGYQEYLDVLHAAWSFNRSLDAEAPPFRVVALGLPSYVEDPDLLDGRSASEVVLRNWWLGGDYRDVTAVHVANVLTREVVRHGERALAYLDVSRTTTRLLEWTDGRPHVSPGNLLYNWIGEGVQRVLLHGALDDAAVLAGVERLVEGSPDGVPTFGVDLDVSTIGDVPVRSIVGSVDGGSEPLRLGDVADGYVYLLPREEWRPVSLADDFLRADNLAEAERRYRALDPRDEPYQLEELEQIREEGAAQIEESWPVQPRLDIH